MGFTRFLKGSERNGIGVQIIDESIDKEEFVSDYYEGIYAVKSYGRPLFDVTFIPYFERKTDLWHQHEFLKYEDEDVASSQEARLITATDNEYTVTPDEKKAGTRQEFTVALTPEQEASIRLDRLDTKDFIKRTIYYVTPKEFYTFRGELVTIKSEKNMASLDLINLKEILNFSFIQFILNNVVTAEKLEQFKKKAGVDLVKV